MTARVTAHVTPRLDRRPSRRRARHALLATLAALSACLPSPPPPPRYFTPGMAAPASPESPTPVRLGFVRSPLHLRDTMTWRRGDEYGFYEQRRWAELPSAYVERALAHELFPDGGARFGVSDAAPLVTVEIRAFEEVLAPVHEARVAIAVHVADARCVRLRETFAATRPLAGDDPTAFARGIGESLDEVAAAAGRAVRRAATLRDGCRAGS
jgi:ABC-type uncharacterized transport system auxiliary subunit